MANVLSASGLTLATQAELIAYFTAQYQAIYGADINLAPDSPDGQMMMIFIQAIMDQQDAMLEVYNSMNPDSAFGVTLDQRVAINGIQRQAGTYTTTFVTLVVSQALTIFGLDQELQDQFTVQDNAGTKWILMESISLPTADTYVLMFRSEKPGQVYTTPNTITVPVTIVLGVTSINNPTTYATLGINEETDYDLKIRRQRSVALSAQGYYEALLAALLNITGMASAQVYENDTASTDADGIPSHSIWVIVSGTAAPAAIANAIYRKRNAGAGMKGSQVYSIAQTGGSFPVRWDNVSPETLFIKFTLTSLDGVNIPDVASIRSVLVTSFIPGVATQVNINDLADKIRAIDSNALVTNAGFCLTSGGTYTSTLTPSAKNKQFAVTSPNIIILPIIVSPSSAAVLNAATRQFTSLGGFGSIVWSIATNVSGGSINSSTGLYTAGAVDGTDIIRATDSLGNFTAANVTVT